MRPGLRNLGGSGELVEMAMAYMRSDLLCAAARLGVADAMAAGARTTQQIADACHADAPAMHRLLRAMAALGLTEQVDAQSFRLTPKGESLRKDAANTSWPAVVFWADLLADSWSHLGECVRSGRTAAKVMQQAGISSRWSQDPDAGAIFRAVMGTGPGVDYAPIAAAWPFPAHGTIADLGGGGGELIRAVLEAFPTARGMLVDREASIEAAAARFAPEHGAPEHGAPEQDAGEQDAAGPAGGRCKLLVADLCAHVPEGAEIYMLKHVLHGYTDEVALSILKLCRQVVPAHGAVLVIEFVLPDVVAQESPELAARFMSDLNMMAVTGGRERSEAEWRGLLSGAGLRLTQSILVPELDVSILEARPL